MKGKEVQALAALLGQQVSVWTGEKIARHTFEPAICVSGVLEKHPDTLDYRVVINEGTYVYFKLENLVEITTHTDKFKDGSVALIKISMNVVPAYLSEDTEHYQQFIY